MTVTVIPLWIVDVAGSILMILFSFLCLHYVTALKRRDPDNVIWTYLQWVCFGLAGFAISRSVGHLVKDFLVLGGRKDIWATLRPYSGAVNTLMLVVVSSVTLFFERIWVIYRQILKDKQALQAVNEKVLYLNQNLEQLVEERTAELAFSEHKYRRIFEISKDMILVTDRQGAIVDLNPAGRSILGETDDAKGPIGAPFADHFADRQDWHAIAAALQNQGYVLNVEAELLGPDSNKRRYLISANRDIGLDNQTTIHYLVKDIEQKRLMEQQIAQADKLASLGQLSAGVAHEINNPMGIILGYTQLLIRDQHKDSEAHSDLKIIEKHVKNCKTIVEDLLNFARSSKTQKESLKIHVALDEVLKFVRQHADMERLQIVRSYDREAPPLLLDAKKIKQVMINLIMNAHHAVAPEGRIELVTRHEAQVGRVVVQVIDDGYGIDKENLSRIFDPFFTTKATGEGTGLGLSVSYGIIKEHGGDIRVESQPGKGSTFTVTLPVATDPPEALQNSVSN